MLCPTIISKARVGQEMIDGNIGVGGRAGNSENNSYALLHIERNQGFQNGRKCQGRGGEG